METCSQKTAVLKAVSRKTNALCFSISSKWRKKQTIIVPLQKDHYADGLLFQANVNVPERNCAHGDL